MNVAVLPYTCATLWITYFMTWFQSARCTSVLNLVPISSWPGAATFMVHFDRHAHLLEQQAHFGTHVLERSTGGTGK